MSSQFKETGVTATTPPTETTPLSPSTSLTASSSLTASRSLSATTPLTASRSLSATTPLTASRSLSATTSLSASSSLSATTPLSASTATVISTSATEDNREAQGYDSSALELANVRLLQESKVKLSYSFQSGKLYLLSGQNGAGKSTLLKGLAGITSVAEGVIKVGEHRLSSSSWRGRTVWNKTALQSIHYVPQHVEDMWLCGTIGAELALLAKQYAAIEGDQLNRLEQVLTDFGFDPSTYERELLSLSLGEQKRVALAIAFCLQGDWLLLDEPMAALDEAGRKLVLERIKLRKAQGKGMIIVSHQLSELMPLIDHHLTLSPAGLQEAEKESDLEEALFLRLLQETEGNDSLLPTTGNRELIAASDGMRAADSPKLDEPAEQQLLTDPHGRDKEVSPLPSLFDPRALMLSMIISTASLIFWNSWLSIGLYALLGMIVTALLFREASRWSGIILGFMFMTVILILVGSISLSSLSFELSSALTIAQRMLSLLVIIVLGLPILSLMTPFRLQRALQQTITPLRARVPALDSYALLVSLIFRFVPLLTGRWGALQAISRSRFKVSRSISWSMFPALMLAYVRSILKLADQLATSLELRGYDLVNRQPLLYARVLWRAQDYWLIALMLGLMLLNAAIHQWL